jgi:hypothetical protein
MLLGFDKYSTTVRVQIVFPTSQENLPEHDVRNQINSAIEGALERAFPATAVLVSVDTPEMKWIAAVVCCVMSPRTILIISVGQGDGGGRGSKRHSGPVSCSSDTQSDASRFLTRCRKALSNMEAFVDLCCL